ncbi:hypothetical protein PQX77_004305 [Marasmius sp. AFHP31]|nr:hypothetical protein PQX77_004305 [Marasmius sp. AFHP31]
MHAAATVLPAPCPPRRRRIRAKPIKTPINRRTRIRVPNPVNHGRDPWRSVRKESPKSHVLTMSVTDLYKAMRRSMDNVPWQKNISDEDRAILQKVRSTSIRHEMISGVKAVEEKILAVNGVDIEALERQRRAIALKVEVRQLKSHWARLVKAALRGWKVSIDTPAKDIVRWNWYEAAWVAIETGELRCHIPFEELPWPTLNLDKLDLEDYETFVLSPARPRFETMYWFERVEHERKRWNIHNIKNKVIPLVSEDIAERVVECADVLSNYIDLLVEKYCDE